MKWLTSILALMALSTFCGAHSINLIELDISQTDDTHYEIKLPLKLNVTIPLVRPSLPEHCQYQTKDLTLNSGQTFKFQCQNSNFSVTDQLTINWSISTIHVTSHWLDTPIKQQLFYADENGQVTIKFQKLNDLSGSWLNTSLQYSVLGVQHLAGGYDHLLFVIGMFLLLGWHKKLFYSVTAFTVAHSITLAITYFQWINLNPGPVEACISLSIAVLAAEVIRKRQHFSSLTYQYPALICGSMGLLHGLGFAGALADIGVNEQSITPALLGFNLGLEVGQLMFISALFALKLLIGFFIKRSTYLKSAASMLEYMFAYGMGAIAFTWTLQRVLA